ncbi:MAG: glycosyltransferase [Oligoflexia bacterium]|nr:glycosyltransferase [Oligoflexia bacterium]
MINVGLIPAAGEGLRAYPLTTIMPKPLFKIHEKSILKMNLEIMRDQVGIKEVFIIVGHLEEMIKREFQDGSSLGIKIRYIKCDNVKIGLAKGLLLAKDFIRENFLCILGDEVYLNSNHSDLKTHICGAENEYDVICGVKLTGNISSIKKNYSLKIEKDKISRLTEKPRYIENNYLGCGTYIFSTKIFDYIEQTTSNTVSNRVELTDVINNIAKDKGTVYPFYLGGDYININCVDDLNEARYLYKKTNFKKFKVSLIIPAWNEEMSIGIVIDEFKKYVDEIVVADNNSTDETAIIAKDKGAKVLSKNLKGYGDALKYGMNNATGDIFILVEADASFCSEDLPKILEFMKDADMVIGTRTTKQLIKQGANMKFLLRWGNVLASKVLELLWIHQEPRFTDLGCTFRGIWKDSYYKIRDDLKSVGPEFSPEMMVEILRYKMKIIEIPVSYRARIGGLSKHSSNFFNVVLTGLKMLKLIFLKRISVY